MRTLKPVFGMAGALVPILYCGGLLYYFVGVGGSIQEATDSGLGPTMLGLGVVGLLFCIPFLLKMVRLFARPRTPGTGGGPDVSGDDDNSGREAEAAIARYMAQRPAQDATSRPAAPPAQRSSGGPAGRTGFGRRVS